MVIKNSRFISTILIILIILITAITVYSISTETRQALKGAVQEKLVAVASTTASQVNGDEFAAIRSGDESTGRYLQIRNQFRAVKESVPDIRYIYTLRKTGDTVHFVVDGDFGYEADAAKIGEAYPEAEPELFAGFVTPTADKDFTTDSWGTVLSGFAPIHDHNGTVVGIVGIDMDSSVVNAELNYINNVIYGIGFLAMILSIIGIIFIEHRRIADERKIAESEKKYRLLFERAGDAIFLIGTGEHDRGVIISANQAAADLHGYSPGELEGRNIADLVIPEEQLRIFGWEHQMPEGTWLHGELSHRKKDGTEFPVEYSSGLLDLGTKKYLLIISRDISEQKKASNALQQVTKKLALLNSVTFNDIQSSVFTFSGYISLGKTYQDHEKIIRALDKADASVRTISRCLNFAKSYQDLGANPPRWQDVNQVFVMGISHLDFSAFKRSVHLDSLEIYADPLLEQVFLTLASNVVAHAKTATRVTLGYEFAGTRLVLLFQDNGAGIDAALKEKIFLRGFGSQKGMELFLVREILSITGITITETGEPGKGARFEISVPKEAWRIRGKGE